jgi:hypothetical protein
MYVYTYICICTRSRDWKLKIYRVWPGINAVPSDETIEGLEKLNEVRTSRIRFKSVESFRQVIETNNSDSITHGSLVLSSIYACFFFLEGGRGSVAQNVA